ncbi:MAG: metallophosphoesterase family protein [Brevundimonas sp.]|uniref:metallophosphoesterase family protein n=1 Tax=Brevundimonas sp. TaxID=1871086 RepID=UPI00391ABC9C
MISRFFQRKPKVAAPQAPAVSAGTVVWAIGDIHGRMDLLKPLMDAIEVDAAASSAGRKVVIFLGDYIDRGPDSRAVLRHLAELPTDGDIEWRFLKGNHEDAMLNFLEDGSTGPRWCEYGGDATLRSYGLRVPDMRHKPEAWAHVAADLRHRLTARERTFLEDLEMSAVVGDYFFAHAGARPGLPLTQQDPQDLMWIRRTFLESDVDFECVVVHGHTPTVEVYADRRRIGIDTKAYSSGRLSALRIEGAERAIIQTVPRPEGDHDPAAVVAAAVDRRALSSVP